MNEQDIELALIRMENELALKSCIDMLVTDRNTEVGYLKGAEVIIAMAELPAEEVFLIKEMGNA